MASVSYHNTRPCHAVLSVFVVAVDAAGNLQSVATELNLIMGRGLHSSTFHLNLSRF